MNRTHPKQKRVIKGGTSAIIWIVAATLFVIWLGGMIASSTFGGLLHVLLILVVAAVVFEIVRSRRA
jgi:hypothetical protein